MDFGLAAVDARIDPVNCFVPGVLNVGPPGAGKILIFFLTLAHAKSPGLNVQTTALTQYRSQEVWGTNLHKLLPYTVEIGKEWTNLVAEQVIGTLIKRPLTLAFLQTLDVLGIEEIGLLSAENLSVLDTVLRDIRGDFRPFGNVLIFATGDPGQLAAPKGRGVFTSIHSPVYQSCASAISYAQQETLSSPESSFYFVRALADAFLA